MTEDGDDSGRDGDARQSATRERCERWRERRCFSRAREGYTGREGAGRAYSGANVGTWDDARRRWGREGTAGRRARGAVV